MGTKTSNKSLASGLFGKTRRAVLALLFGRPDEAFYVRQVVRIAGVGQGTVQRELRQLAELGVISRQVRGQQVYFQANRKCPIFSELRGLITKTTGVADVLNDALASLGGRITVAFIYGSVAKGSDKTTSDVDLMVVGKVDFGEVVSAVGSAQETLGREVNPTVYPPDEFRRKITAGHSFLKTVLSEPKVFLIGDEHDLERLAAKRLGDRTDAQP
jgi:predicted nucleotidyltransferase